MEGLSTHIRTIGGTEFHDSQAGNPAVSESGDALVMATELSDIRGLESSSASGIATKLSDITGSESSKASIMTTELQDIRCLESSNALVMATELSNMQGSESSSASVMAPELPDMQPARSKEQGTLNEGDFGDDEMKSIEEYKVQKSSMAHHTTEVPNSMFVSKESVLTSFRDDDYFGTESSVFTLYDSQSQGSSEMSQIWDESYDSEGNELEDHSEIEDNLSHVVHPVELKKCGETVDKDEPLLPVSVGNEITTLLDTTSIEQLKRLWPEGESPSKKSPKSNSPHKKSKTNIVKVNKKTNKSCAKQKDALKKRAAVAKSLKCIELQANPNSSIANKMEREIITKESSVPNVKLKTGNLKRKKKLPPVLKITRKLHPNVQFKMKCCTTPCKVRLQKLESMNLKNTNLHIDLTFPKNLIKKKAKSVKCTIQRNSKAPYIAFDKSSPNKEEKKNAVTDLDGLENVTNGKYFNVDRSNKDAEYSAEMDLAVSNDLQIRKENESGSLGESSGAVPVNSKAQNTAGTKSSEGYFWEDDVEDFDSGNDYVNSDDDYKPSKKENFKNVFTRKKKHGKSPVKNSRNWAVTGNLFVESKEKKDVSKCKNNYNKKRGIDELGQPSVLGHFRCKLCDFTACEKELVDKHRALEHKQLRIKCNFCDKKMRTKDRLLEHEARMHTNAKPFKCQHEGCDYASKVRGDLQRHQSKHATEKSYICQLCGWTTKWRRNLRNHHIMVHTKDRNFHCKICSYTAKRSSDLKQHMFRHSEEKPLACETCGFRVKTNWELRSHMLVHSIEKPFKCSFPGCQAATKTNADLKKHMRSHNPSKSVVCPLCSKAFRDQQTLAKHNNYVHTESRLFRCDVCDKSFKCKAALKKHLNIHLGIKPFECEICGKHFSTKSNMQMHAVTHDVKARPYVCPLCPYAAKETHHLLAHIGSFHGDKYTYFCELCNKPFKRYGQLQIHYRRMHKKASAKLVNSEHVDMALLKMEMELDLEEASGKHSRKQRSKSKTVPSEDGGNTEIKQEPMDTDYENETRANGKELNKIGNASTSKQLGEIENIGNKDCGDLPIKTGTESVHNDTEVEGSVTDCDTEHYDTEIEKLETEMENAGTLECNETEKFDTKEESSDIVANDLKAVLQEQASATLAIYNGLRLPLATKGFMFNYQKNGKKPKSWFMDTSCMDEQSAAKQNTYLRKIGVNPPLSRGKKKKVKPGLAGFLQERARKRKDCLQKSNFIKGIGLMEKAGLSRRVKFKGKYSEFENLEGEDLNAFEVNETLLYNSLKSTKQNGGAKKDKNRKSIKPKTASQMKKTKKLQNSQKKSKQTKILLSSEKKRKGSTKNIAIRKPSYIKISNKDGNSNETLQNASSESTVCAVQSKKKIKEKGKGKIQNATKDKKEKCTLPKTIMSSQIESETGKQKYNKKYVPVKKVKQKGGKEIKSNKRQKEEKPKPSKGCTKTATAQKKSKLKKLKVKITSGNRKLGLFCTVNQNVGTHLQGSVNEANPTVSSYDAQSQSNMYMNDERSFSAEADDDSQFQGLEVSEIKLEAMETDSEAECASVHPVFMIQHAGAESTEGNIETAVYFGGVDMDTGEENSVAVMSSLEEGENGDCRSGEEGDGRSREYGDGRSGEEGGGRNGEEGDGATKDNDVMFDKYFVVKREPTVERDEI